MVAILTHLAFFLLIHKGDGAGRPVFTVNFRVLAFEAFLAHEDLVFQAFI